MRYCISYAYGVRFYQVAGPGWIDNEFYDIVAKIPSSGDPRKMNEMLRTLLAERFKLRIHREKKEFPGYALLVAPGGPKLPKRDGDAERAIRASISQLPSQAFIGNEPLPGGDWRIRGISATMDGLAQSLSIRLSCPVINLTNLKESYDFIVDGSREDVQTGQNASRGGSTDELGPSVFSSIRSIGLQMKPQGVPQDVIVVDYAEKVPTVN
jgi:uncharacterized protein (TIGR03435 family)